MATRGLSPTFSFITPSTTITTTSSCYQRPSSPPTRSPSSPLFPSSLDLLSSSFSSIPFTSQKKRNLKSLAEAQELDRIMDPTYLGSSCSSPLSSFSRSRWSSTINGGGGESHGHGYYYADPEGYWHDIDYRPFPRIKEKFQRSFTSYSSFTTSTTSSYPSDDDDDSILDDPSSYSYSNTKLGSRNKGSTSRKVRDPPAYWETFTVLPCTTTTTSATTTVPAVITTSRQDDDDDEEKLEYFSTLRNLNLSFSRSSPSSRSSYSYSYAEPAVEYDDDDAEGSDTMHRVLKNKNKNKKISKGSRRRENLERDHADDDDGLYISEDNSVSNSSEQPPPSPSSPPPPEVEKKAEEGILRRSKTERLHRTWVTTTFIARLKVIRTKRWLRERCT